MKHRLLALSQRVPAMHVAPALSCAEIVDAVYWGMKRPDDSFVMSKGHGAIMQYVALEELGVLKNLDDYCNGPLGCHPDRGTPGIEASTGSLGHGLGIALGMAYADPTRDVYCLVSDGELMEGSTWEAIMLAATLQVPNLVMLVDYNGMHSSGDIRGAVSRPGMKLWAFGWRTFEVDGHDAEAMVVLGKQNSRRGPMALVCNTVKGHGISFMEGNPIWHYRSPTPEEYRQAVEEIG